MNRLKPDLRVLILILFANLALYAVWIGIVHYVLIVLTVILKQSWLLVVPAIIDVLWIVTGAIAFLRNKTSILLILAGVIGMMLVIVAFIGLR
jgi:hypothetical protein